MDKNKFELDNYSFKGNGEFNKILENLEKLSKQIILKQSYNSNSAVIKAVTEMVKEQLINEDTSYTVRKAG